MRAITIQLAMVCLLTILISKNKLAKDHAPIVNEAPPAALTSTPKMGETYTFHRSVKADWIGSEGHHPFTNLNYDGMVHVDWVYASGNSYVAQLKFESKDGQQSTTPFEISVQDWSLTQIQAGEAKGETENNFQNILKDFATIFAYHSNEDTTGKYRLRAWEQNNVYFKKKISYVNVAALKVTIEKSRHQTHFDTGTAGVLSAEGFDRSRVQFSKKSFIETSSRYSLKKIGVFSAEKFFTGPIAMKIVPTTPLARSIRNWTPWKVLQSGLEQYPHRKHSEQLTLFHDLIKTLKQDHDSLPKFVEWMNDHHDQTELQRLAIGVLATVGSAEAQHALLSTYQDSPGARAMILNSLNTASTSYSAETHDFLSSLAHSSTDLGYGAAYALGSGLRSGAQSGDVDELKSLLTNAKDQNEKGIYLDAIGNSASLAFLPTIKNSLQDESEEVREKAVFALRLMPKDSVQEILLQAKQDSSSRVKAAAEQVDQFQANNKI